METLQIIDGKIEYIGAFGSSGSMLYAEKTGLIDSTYNGIAEIK